MKTRSIQYDPIKPVGKTHYKRQKTHQTTQNAKSDVYETMLVFGAFILFGIASILMCYRVANIVYESTSIAPPPPPPPLGFWQRVLK